MRSRDFSFHCSSKADAELVATRPRPSDPAVPVYLS
jgi:hypothetical protein